MNNHQIKNHAINGEHNRKDIDAIIPIKITAIEIFLFLCACLSKYIPFLFRVFTIKNGSINLKLFKKELSQR